jgi:uncharacterized membrane protein YbaN (DUF454 family)
MDAYEYIRSLKRYIRWYIRDKPEHKYSRCYNNINTGTSVTHIIVIDLLLCLLTMMYLFIYRYNVKTFMNTEHYSKTIVRNNITVKNVCTY